MNRFIIFCCIVTGLLVIAACGKKTEQYPSDDLEEYESPAVGDYILYQLDSTVFVGFGQRDTVITYDAKDVVDGELMDALGRPSWRVVRYIRDTGSTSENDWRSSLTYIITPTRETVEVVENNLRQVKLRLPVKDGFNWLGNSYLPFDPYSDIFPFNNDEDIQYWNFTYSDIGASQDILGKTYNNTITITHVDDSINVPIFSPDAIALKTKWVEQYAKGIGLVYKETLLWEYQPPNGGNPGYRHGFGIRLRIVEYGHE